MRLHRRHFITGCACAACAVPLPVQRALADWVELEADIPPGYNPADDIKDEAGLWMVMEKYQEQLDRSSFVIRDAALNDYVNSIVARLAGPYANDIKVYIVNRPFFNATMAPNGVMQIWSGLLLRMQSEAELAAVLGHEIGHYLRRHSLDRFRNARNTSSALSFLTFGVAAGGGGAGGGLAQLLALAMIFGYSRRQETEADQYGLQLMNKAGYDGYAARDVWAGVVAEDAAYEEDTGKKMKRGSPILATHPASDDRMLKLSELASIMAVSAKDPQRHAGRYYEALRAHRLGFMEDQLELNQTGRTLFLLERLAADPLVSSEAQFFKGEVYRRRGEEGDYDLALHAYDAALEAGTPPPQLFRSVGLIRLKQRNREAARSALTQYLTLVPNAEDKAMILFYLQ